MKAIIIEDEELSAKHLEFLLKKIDPEIEVLAVYDSVKKSVAAFEAGMKADLLFVDIHLADGLSFEIFAKTKMETPVVFTTAYDEYAIKAFKLNSIDYLLKPIGLNDLSFAIEKYKTHFHDKNALEKVASLYLQMNKPNKNRFMVKTHDGISTVKSEDISHFISEDGNVLLVTVTGRRYIIDYTLDALEATVANDIFFRINRKVIVNINAIQKVSNYFNGRLKLTTAHVQEEDNIVSRERVNEFKSWLDK